MLRNTFLSFALLAILGSFAILPFEANTEAPRATNSAQELGVSNDIIFDSNRSGTFGIYRLNSSTGAISKVYDSPLQEMYPSPSPDGKRFVFAKFKKLKRDAPGEIWIANIDGSNAKLLSKQGAFPTFSADGSKVYFELGKRKLMSIPSIGGESVELFPAGNKDFGNHFVVKPKVSPDGKSVAFATDLGGRWNAWTANLETGKLARIAHGCQPTWYPDATKLAWIRTGNSKERSGVFSFTPGVKTIEEVQDADAPWGHEYFPQITSDGKFLLFASCPPKHHSHFDGNYQLFIRNLENNKTMKLTQDLHTNRWPSLIPQ